MKYATAHDFMEGIITDCLDSWYGAVSSYSPGKVTGNGLLYTALAVVLSKDRFNAVAPGLRYTWSKLIFLCLNDGCVMRTMDNKFGQESIDDYLAVATASILFNDRAPARTILKYGIKHFFFFNNADKFTFASFLGRFPQVWVLMFAAAFPALKYILWPIIKLLTLFMYPSPTSSEDTIHLSYLFFSAKQFLYDDASIHLWFKKLGSLDVLARSFESYFGPTHPFTILERNE